MEEILKLVLEKQGFKQQGDNQLWCKISTNVNILIAIMDQDIEVKVSNIPHSYCHIEYKTLIPKSDIIHRNNEDDVYFIIKHHVRMSMLNIRAHAFGMKKDIEKHYSLF